MLYRFYFIVFITLAFFTKAQKGFYDPNILPFDSLSYKIVKVSESQTADNILDTILNFNTLLVGEQHKWKENTSFYKSIFDENKKLYPELKTIILFENCVTFQKPFNDYITSKDSIKFKKQMHYINSSGGIDRMLFENHLSFYISALVNSKFNNYKFYCIDQYASTDGYVRAINIILSDYKDVPFISKRIKQQNLLLKKLQKSVNKDSIRAMSFSLMSDTIAVFKTLNKLDVECYNSVLYAFSKSPIHNPSFFELWKIREEFLIENLISKSDSLRQHTIFFGGANHVNYTRYADGFFGKKPTVPSMANYLKQKFNHSEIETLSFDVINKNETKFTRSVEAVMLSDAKAYTNRFWQKITSNETLNEFNLYKFSSNVKSFDYIILKKAGTDLYDNDDYLKLKK